jgi:hypothetical protein
VGSARAVVPRHWLARMLHRIVLHRPSLGYVETYGGFFYDDRTSRHGFVRFGVRTPGAALSPLAHARGTDPPPAAEVRLAPSAAAALVETMYRAVAPEGYVEL